MKVEAQALTLGALAQVLKEQGEAGLRARCPTAVLLVVLPGTARRPADPPLRTDETTHEVEIGNRTITKADKLRADTGPTPPPPPRTPVKGFPVVGPDSVVRPLVKSDRNTTPDLTVGRTATNDVVIDAVEVSKVHAWLKGSGTSFSIVDQGSTNGTFIDGVRLQPKLEHRLRPGARLRFGTILCMYATADELIELCAGL